MSATAESLIHRHRYSVQDYYRMVDSGILAPDARVELIDGEVIEMPPIGARHASLVTDLQNLLIAAVGARALIRVQSPVHLDGYNEPEPDIALVRPQARRYRERHPQPSDCLLLIEVAESTLRYDRDVKIALYSRHGIPDAWLIDTGSATLTVYRQPAPDGCRELIRWAALDRVPVPGLDPLHVDLSQVIG